MKRTFKNNNGSTLILVIIAISFIVILSTLILSLTVTNLQISQVNYDSIDNFNKTENVMNELHSGLEKLSSDCMYKAYDYLLLHYSEIAQDPDKSLKGEFDAKYIQALVKELTGETYDSSVAAYYYLPQLMKSFLITVSNPNDVFLYNDTDRSTNLLTIKLDTSDESKTNYVILKNIKVKYINSIGYETSITTDIKLDVPNLNFNTFNIYPEFTKYTLIADQGLQAQGASGMNIDGNIYTGADGIKVDGSNVITPDANSSTGYNLRINGNYMITRGDISVFNYAKLFIGNASPMNIWAENITTGGNSSDETSYLNINGNIKVADDLMLKARNSQVIIKGNYHGFNYNKTNNVDGDITDPVDSKYSSSILINGINSSLDMSGVNSLIVKGRAFISRQSEKDSAAGTGGSSDIMTGESVAVKSNQAAYLVPNTYIWCGHNPITQAELTAKPSGTSEVDLSTAPDDLKSLLTLRGYTEYYYQISGMTIKYYYFEFKDQQSANTYFRNYVSDSSGKAELEKNADPYLVDTGIGIHLSANLLSVANALTFYTGTHSTLHNPSLGILDNTNENLKAMLKDSIKTAYEYKSLQLSLQPVSNHMAGTDFRLEKTESPLFQTLMKFKGKDTPEPSDDKSKIEEEAFMGNSFGFLDKNGMKIKTIPFTIGSDSCSVTIVYNPGNTFSLLRDMDTNNKGILVATGDVKVDKDYEGLVISGGTIFMMNNNITMKANPSLVQQIFSYALQMEGSVWSSDPSKKFTQYFSAYYNSSSENTENIERVDISRYITYENWSKNAD